MGTFVYIYFSNTRDRINCCLVHVECLSILQGEDSYRYIVSGNSCVLVEEEKKSRE